jgi:hypothetical protein
VSDKISYETVHRWRQKFLTGTESVRDATKSGQPVTVINYSLSLIPFQVDKRIMCLTVVLGLTNDEDRFIRASAVRTLGVYVLYKSHREVSIPTLSCVTNFVIAA